MALLLTSLLHSSSSTSSSLHSLLLLQSQNQSSKTCKSRFFSLHSTIRAQNQRSGSSRPALAPARRKRQSRPLFVDQVRQKWPLNPDSDIQKLPWRESEEQESEEEPEPEISSSGGEIGEEGPVIEHDLIGESISILFGSENRESVDSESRMVQADDAMPMVELEVSSSVHESGIGEEEPVIEPGRTGSGSSGESISPQFGYENVKDDDAMPMVELEDGDTSSAYLPWERDVGAMEVSVVDGDRKRWRNIESAEKVLPELELRRLRNAAVRMLERTRVGVEGITQALVDSIHQKWIVDEMVKLTFDEPFSLSMKRTHQIIESKTGGLVIWRSGSSIVLYRGIEYKVPCVQSYTENSLPSISRHSNAVVNGETDTVQGKNSFEAKDSYNPDSEVYLKDLAKEEIMDLAEINHFLDGLGPRFRDWSGRDPLPVDADRLPSVVPGYKPPLRTIPHGRMNRLRHREITDYRRLARTMPPHFALGRNRELQGLAEAMVKLWQKNAIAKIAVKRGVQNTSNERMAEVLKKLTGGILLIRNKDFMVFYRGNDFLPSAVTDALRERHRLAELRQDEEELARQMTSASISSSAKTSKGPLVAGTLAETMAATSRWGSQPSDEDLENMMKESVLIKRAASVRYLEKKLADAKAKAQKADKALAKVQKHLEPAELPTDLEILTDEERFLFQKMGRSMKPFLLLGRRGIYDGTILNMHLHWKHRELVKIVVRRKRLSQVKHIAISLEAESGGVLVSIDKTMEGHHAIIVYRGKNYLPPTEMRPKNLLTKRQAFARSIELQRREALKHHISGLQKNIDLLSSELEDIRNGKIDVKESLYSRTDDANFSDVDMEEIEEEESYPETNYYSDEESYSLNEEN